MQMNTNANLELQKSHIVFNAKCLTFLT